jgi:DMSO/TMAO reductase YedYZ molybdopterin-dependent catalytic subunit
MHVIRRRGWEIAARLATPEHLFLDRRAFLTATSAAALSLAPGMTLAQRVTDLPDPTRDLYPAQRNETFTLDRPVTEEKININYNNFYEFGSSKNVAKAAQALKLRPWTVKIDGMVEKAQEIGIDDLIRKMPLEERLYRHRCVEAWSMAIPWSGFPFAKLVDMAKPLSSAKYVRMETFLDPSVAPGQKQSWYPWPFVEGAGCAAAAGGAVEIRLQVDQVDRALQLHGSAAEELLGGLAGQRVRLLGQRQSGGIASALEPGHGGSDRTEPAPPDADVQWLWRLRRRPLQRARERAALGLSVFTLSRCGGATEPAD